VNPVILQAPLGDNPPTARLYYGQDVLQSLKLLPDASVHSVITSPPYWGLRNYQNVSTVWGGSTDCDHEWGDTIPGSNRGGSGTPTDKNNRGEGYGRNAPRGNLCEKCGAWRGSLGLEPTPDLFVEHMVLVFREVARVLRPDGTLWLNLGDSYTSGGRTWRAPDSKDGKAGREADTRPQTPEGLKPKDLVGIPWRVALALQTDGWYLRSDIIWAKKNPMPESVRDRPTSAHEHVFLLAHPDSGGRYFYDPNAVREKTAAYARKGGTAPTRDGMTTHGKGSNTLHQMSVGGRNRRDVWAVATRPYKGAHSAVWPPALVEPMVLAATSEKGVCANCEAPWTRGLTTLNPKETGAAIGGDPDGQDGGFRMRDPSKMGSNHRATRRQGTNTWIPGCTCGAGITRATVLDPFSGSGTTGMVALSKGRDYIGLDLNAEYRPLAEARILGYKSSGTEVPIKEGILDFFGVP